MIWNCLILMPFYHDTVDAVGPLLWLFDSYETPLLFVGFEMNRSALIP